MENSFICGRDHTRETFSRTVLSAVETTWSTKKSPFSISSEQRDRVRLQLAAQFVPANQIRTDFTHHTVALNPIISFGGVRILLSGSKYTRVEDRLLCGTQMLL